MKVTVNVTREHLANGQRNNNTRCAVALALKDAGVKFGWCGSFGIYPALHDYTAIAKWTADITEQIRRFDDGEMLEPFCFELEVP